MRYAHSPCFCSLCVTFQSLVAMLLSVLTVPHGMHSSFPSHPNAATYSSSSQHWRSEMNLAHFPVILNWHSVLSIGVTKRFPNSTSPLATYSFSAPQGLRMITPPHANYSLPIQTTETLMRYRDVICHCNYSVDIAPPNPLPHLLRVGYIAATTESVVTA